MKKCTKCGIEKPLSEFHKDKSKKDGLETRCKPCRKVIQAADYQKHIDKRTKYSQAYRTEHRRERREYCVLWRKQRKDNQPACIYQITNKQNGKIYVGETLRGEIRWKQHLKELRGGYHANSKLQKDFDKFGEESFEWEILKEFPKDKETLLLEEVRTISKFLKEDKELYNLSLAIEQLKLLQENGE